MKKVLISVCSIFLFTQTATSNSEKPISRNLIAKAKYVKVPLRFKTYHSYFQYLSIKAYKGIDSATAFYRKGFEKATETYTDPWLLLTGGTLTGTLNGTDAGFTGYVGIGTTSPDAPLVVNATSGNGSGRISFKSGGTWFGGIGTGDWALGDGTTDLTMLSNSALRFATNNATAVKMYISTGGNIGIGTIAPGQKLEVNGAIASINGVSDYAANSDNAIFSYTSTGGSSTYPFNLNGNLFIQPRTSAARDIVFATAASAGAPSTRMIISSTGNVGIGTTSPGQKLEIQDVGFMGTAMDFIANKYESGFYNTSTGGSNTYPFDGNGRLVIQPRTSSSGSTSQIIFATGGTTPSARMIIDHTGNVGIGTTSPDGPLVVNATSGNGSGRISFKTGGTRFGSIGTGNWALGDGTTDMTVLSDAALRFATNNATAVRMYISTGGNVGIGTTDPIHKLSVGGDISANGEIIGKKLTVTQTPWSDYVFAKDYKLRSLESLEAFINQYKHLPEVPTAKEVEENGVSVGDNQALLLKKIEELTLYIIEQQKQLNRQSREIQQLKNIKK